MLKALKASGAIRTLDSSQTSNAQEFDLLIVGGGATGAGCAVDAASRGLKVALLERDDFGAGKQSDPFVSPIMLLDIFLNRHILEIHKTCPWWRSLSAKGGL